MIAEKRKQHSHRECKIKKRKRLLTLESFQSDDSIHETSAPTSPEKPAVQKNTNDHGSVLQNGDLPRDHIFYKVLRNALEFAQKSSDRRQQFAHNKVVILVVEILAF